MWWFRGGGMAEELFFIPPLEGSGDHMKQADEMSSEQQHGCENEAEAE